ncbi:MAG: SDR family NAD(P)-dependent oxidoreductase [Chloroflexi bacterium]|nr:SDR family NAD(P)-dependent oxidoreductase [Chloroflexota bacterium]
MPEKPLEGKVAMVTGAGSPIGLGFNMASALVEAGARVAMVDVNEEWLDQSANDIREIAGDDSVVTILADVADASSAEAAVRAAITHLGGLHILINNAGISAGNLNAPETTHFWDITPDMWQRVISVNFSGPFNMARAAVGHMMDQGWGRIIGVTTSFDTMFRLGVTPYGPSKAGHEAFIALMSRELEGTGVTANVLVPGGATNTNLLPANTVLDRSAIIQPEIMRSPVVWLASEQSDGINGQRFIAQFWDESLPLEQRIEKAGAPAAWPQLGRQAPSPGT